LNIRLLLFQILILPPVISDGSKSSSDTISGRQGQLPVAVKVCSAFSIVATCKIWAALLIRTLRPLLMC
jgi:hypothetical protein